MVDLSSLGQYASEYSSLLDQLDIALEDVLSLTDDRTLKKKLPLGKRVSRMFKGSKSKAQREALDEWEGMKVSFSPNFLKHGVPESTQH